MGRKRLKRRSNIRENKHPEVKEQITNKRRRGYSVQTKGKGIKDLTKEEFGDLLAGLMDSDGHISKYGIKICLSEIEREIGEELLERIGGQVKKVKGKKAYNIEILRKEKIKEVGRLINGRLRLEKKINQYNERLGIRIKELEETKKPISGLRDNYWLTGFVMGDGSLQIKVLDRGKREEVRLAVQIDLKGKELLEEIKGEMGGNIGYRKKTDTYYYSSTSFKVAENWVEYLDRYNLIGPKYEEYKL